MSRFLALFFIFFIPVFGSYSVEYYGNTQTERNKKKTCILYKERYLRDKIVRLALEKQRLNIKYVVINGKRVRVDCSNFVRYIYYTVLQKDFFQEAIRLGIYTRLKSDEFFSRSNFGVLLIYIVFKVKYKIVRKPKRGDIVFFDRTYDKNRNRTLKDDILTHIGIVTDIWNDGTIEFVHAGTSRGIEIGVLNFKHKDKFIVNGRYVNSYIQRKYFWHKKSETAASLVRGFGSIF